MNGPKQALRESKIVARLRLSSEDRASLSHTIAARVIALEAFERARTLALYSPMGAEVDTAEIAQAAAAERTQAGSGVMISDRGRFMSQVPPGRSGSPSRSRIASARTCELMSLSR